MSQTQTTRLRESRAPIRHGVKVIDAEYEVIGRRTVWRRVMTALTAVFWAAAISESSLAVVAWVLFRRGTWKLKVV